MNIQGGGLSFEISGSNDKLLSVLNESKKAYQPGGGRDMQDADGHYSGS